MSVHANDDFTPLAREKIWRDLSYDVAWEANACGVIRCRAVHNHRCDISNAIEGVNLRTLWCDSSHKNALELLSAVRVFRHVEIRIPALRGAGRFYLTAGLLPEGGSAGVISAVHPNDDEVFKRQSELLSHIIQARIRQ